LTRKGEKGLDVIRTSVVEKKDTGNFRGSQWGMRSFRKGGRKIAQIKKEREKRGRREDS